MRLRTVVMMMSVALAAGAVDAADDGPKAAIVDDVSYATARARELWRPMAGSAEVSAVQQGGRRALRMPCTFRGTRIDRASWDRTVALDLTRAKGLRFAMQCADASPVGHFTVYLRSGKGWYKGGFSAPPGQGWGQVTIAKSTMSTEGAPTGWGRIDAIRLSAWRGKNVDTVFHIADLRLYGLVTGGVVIVRGDQALTRGAGEAESVRRYPAVIAGMLDDAGLANVVMSDSDLTASRLAGVKLVVLPYNPVMDDRTAGVLAGYLNKGGKLLSCYHLPRRLAPVVGIARGRHIRQKRPGHFASIRPVTGLLPGAPQATGQASWNIGAASPVAGKSRVAAWWYGADGRTTGHAAVVASDNCVHLTHVLLPDDRTNKQQFVLAMVGQASPGLWRQIAAGRITRIGTFGPYTDVAAARAGISKLAGAYRPAVEALQRGSDLAARAKKEASAGEHIAAAATAGRARRAMLDAYLRARKPVAGEHRAFWCHRAFGVRGMTWDQAIKTLADNGFTAILPNMLWGQTAFYPSTVLPVSPQVADKGDQIALCLAACKTYGVACHVWKVNFNMGWHASKKTAADMTARGRTQVGFDGKSYPRWLCPSHPDNQALEIASMVEVARTYAVDGLHFDYIRYPGRSHCFCAGCRTRFQTSAGVTVACWPADVRTDAALEAKWLDFRRAQITAVVAAVATQARKVRPGLKISAAVFRNWPVDRDGVGQDWKLWCEKGYLDFVCPMDYTPDTAQFERMVTSQLEWAGKVPCYPGIGLSTWADAADVCTLIDQIDVTRRLKTGGFTVFNYSTAEARDVLPALGKGMTRKR